MKTGLRIPGSNTAFLCPWCAGIRRMERKRKERGQMGFLEAWELTRVAAATGGDEEE